MLDAAHIAALLEPYIDAPIPVDLVAQLPTYLDLLLRWNARINLTAVRGPEQIVTRHFGESLFAAGILRDAGAFNDTQDGTPTLSDIGSGAGFPGIPIKLFAPEIHLTLIESHHKKATFLREVIRALDLKNAGVFCGRAESWNHTANVVTVRAVENFDQTLPIAAGLVAPGGTLCLLIGAGQLEATQSTLGKQWRFQTPFAVPLSEERIVVVGNASSV